MILKGKALIIKADGEAIAACKTCKISITAERMEVSDTSNGKWKRYRIGRLSWAVSTSNLVTTISRSANMVGRTVQIEVGIAPNTGNEFGGFVTNAPITSGTYIGTPQRIVWDKTRKQFLGLVGSFAYYESWTNDDAYTDPSPYELFTYLDVSYTWLNDDLTAEKLTGNADVLRWDCQGGVGHLATGAFEFGGNGALTPASLP